MGQESRVSHIRELAGIPVVDMSLLALLRAIAERLIPGIPDETRISILQQTRLVDDEQKTEAAGSSSSTVLEEVIEKATAKQALEKEVKGMNSKPRSGAATNSRVYSVERCRECYGSLCPGSDTEATEACQASRTPVQAAEGSLSPKRSSRFAGSQSARCV